MKAFKDFTVVQNPTDEHGKFFNEDYTGRNQICERRCGITVKVVPQSNGTWKWEIFQQAGKLSGNGWKYSNFTCQEQEGIVTSFEEGQKIVTELYKSWMNK